MGLGKVMLFYGEMWCGVEQRVDGKWEYSNRRWLDLAVYPLPPSGEAVVAFQWALIKALQNEMLQLTPITRRVGTASKWSGMGEWDVIIRMLTSSSLFVPSSSWAPSASSESYPTSRSGGITPSHPRYPVWSLFYLPLPYCLLTRESGASGYMTQIHPIEEFIQMKRLCYFSDLCSDRWARPTVVRVSDPWCFREVLRPNLFSADWLFGYCGSTG